AAEGFWAGLAWGLEVGAVWGAVMAVLSLIPMIGAFLVWIPAAIFLAVSGDYHIGWAIFLTLWGIIVVGQIDNVVRPKLVASVSEVHPVITLLGIFFGIKVRLNGKSLLRRVLRLLRKGRKSRKKL
ncbi:MAG: AI-2E family transporter, partial [Thermoplasmata archaeon]